jgi:hypothetical protein
MRWFLVLIVLSLAFSGLAAPPAPAALAAGDAREALPHPPTFNWLDRVNAVRAAADLPPVVEDAEWSAGSRLHSRYMVKNNYLAHNEAAENPWYTLEGHEAAENGIAYANDGYDASEQRGVDALLTTPFHLLAVLDPRLVKSGFGWYRESKDAFQAGVTLDVNRGLSLYAPPTAYPIVFPGDGKTMPFSHYYGTEHPDPWTSCPGGDFVGAPIIAQLGSAPDDVSVKLVKDGVTLERCIFDETSYTHPHEETQEAGRAILAARHAVVMMTRKPLSAGRYSVSLTSGDTTYSWSFLGPTVSASPDSTVLTRASQSSSQVAAPDRAVPPAPTPTCPTQPSVTFGARHLDDDLLQVIVAARGESNVLHALHFGMSSRPFTNAVVSLPGYPAPIAGELSVSLPPDATQRSFVVRRVDNERSTVAVITATDNCGDWSVIVSADPDEALRASGRPGD